MSKPQASRSDAPRDFVPAAPDLQRYDSLVDSMARGAYWRAVLHRQIAPAAGDVIADIGCGTASQLKLLAQTGLPLTLIGIDPDPAVLELARKKVAGLAAPVEFQHGYARDAQRLLKGRRVNKIVCSLMFHQVPPAEKLAGLIAMHAALVAGGSLHVGDYGLQRTPLMRRRFRLVQQGDGFENTEPNALGVLTDLMFDAGFRQVREMHIIPTPTGSFSIYRARRER